MKNFLFTICAEHGSGGQSVSCLRSSNGESLEQKNISLKTAQDVEQMKVPYIEVQPYPAYAGAAGTDSVGARVVDSR